MYTTTLQAGERSGNLPEVLDRYVSFQHVALTLRKKLVGALIYPCVLFTLICGLMIFMFTVVIPQFAQLYDQLNTPLPVITQWLLAFGKLAQRSIIWVALAGVGAGAAFRRFARTDRGKDFVDGFRVGLPIFGKIWIKHQVALFSRTLATLLTGGLPLMPSLDTAARSISSRKVSMAVLNSLETVREGKGLSESLGKTATFPSLALEMITVGEQTGALPQMLNSVAEFFEEDVATATTAALSLIEPAILLIMGVVALFILISLYLPIFSLGQASGT